MDIGLVLSGGGFRGIAHIGVIRALEEHHIYPTHISGTSAGAVVGAFYANGCPWEEILDFFKTVHLFSINNYALKKPGFVDAEKFYDRFLKYLFVDSFEHLKKHLYVTATNILDGTLKVFHQGELIRPVLASAAFPGVFAPVKIGEGYYVDGGVLNNFPTEVLKAHCDRIIGVYVNPFENVRIRDLKNFYSVVERTFKIKTAKECLVKFNDCDLVICPKDLANYSTFRVKDVDRIFNLGYKAAKNALRTYTITKQKSPPQKTLSH